MLYFKPKWPMPKFNVGHQPHFLFIVTPPYSGSTALTELLNTSHRTMVLQRHGEGQWLVPGLCTNDRWNPAKKVNYDSVKAVWLSKFQQVHKLTKTIDTVIEKSPPNMMRIETLSAQFQDCSFIANNRNPYANCASILYRQHAVEKLGAQKRLAVLKTLAEAWLTRSCKIKTLVLEKAMPLITYEAFCQNPAIVLEKLVLPGGVLDTINLTSKVKVKNYGMQEIQDHNARQISKLTPDDLDALSGVFSKDEALLAFFGYKIMD